MAASGGRRSSFISGVSTMPGTNENTATPASFPISRATVNAIERSAIFVPEYATARGDPSYAIMFTMTPVRRSSMPGSRCLISRNGARALVANVCVPLRKVERDERGHRRVQGVVDENVDRAEGSDRPRDHRRQLVHIAEVARDEPRLTAAGLDRVGDGLPGREPVDDDDPSPEGRHRRRSGLADAARPSGDERHPPRESGPRETQPVDEIPIDAVHAPPRAPGGTGRRLRRGA